MLVFVSPCVLRHGFSNVHQVVDMVLIRIGATGVKLFPQELGA